MGIPASASAELVQRANPARAIDPQVAIGANGGVLTWLSGRTLKIARLGPEGRMRGRVRTVDRDVPWIYTAPTLAVDGTGAAVLAWRADDATAPAIFGERRRCCLGVFAAIIDRRGRVTRQVLSIPGSPVDNDPVVAASGGTLVVAWADRDGVSAAVARRRRPFGPPQLLATGSLSVHDVGVDRRGRAVVTWTSWEEDGVRRRQVRWAPGRRVGLPRTLAGPASSEHLPWLITTTSGTRLMGWKSASGRVRVRLAKPGRRFGPERLLAPWRATVPATAFDGDGSVVLAVQRTTPVGPVGRLRATWLDAGGVGPSRPVFPQTHGELVRVAANAGLAAMLMSTPDRPVGVYDTPTTATTLVGVFRRRGPVRLTRLHGPYAMPDIAVTGRNVLLAWQSRRGLEIRRVPHA